jgi:hypothetical protein
MDPGAIGTLVRNWIHYDGLASSFYKQSMNARKVRDNYEDGIINHLSSTGRENAIIQVGGGRMNIVEEKKPVPLSLSKIEELLHMYYRSRGGRDESLDIMQFIRSNRGYDCKKCLRKTNIAPPNIPALPSAPK